jgi:hypothetical protein
MDKKGYVLSGLSFLLIIPSVILLMVFSDMINSYESPNTSLKSDTIYHIAGNVEENIPFLTKEILKDKSDEIVNTGEPVRNSRKVIKDILQSKIDNFTLKYAEKTGAIVTCEVISVDSAEDPFEIEVRTNTFVKKDKFVINRNISQNISLLDQYPTKNVSIGSNINKSYHLADPLPFIKCKNFGGVNVKDGRIIYGSALSNYLNSRGIQGSQVYENSSSPMYINKCPYSPYICHDNNESFETIKNCVDNGYYHTSSDGACFLCRLEGKATCGHLGIETFIIPSPSIKRTVLTAPCSLDHVIFNDTDTAGTYPGGSVEYQYSLPSSDVFFRIFLDNGHMSKYGLKPYIGL